MEWKYWGEPFAKGYMATEGKHPALRIATGIWKAVQSMPVYIEPEDVIVGDPIPHAIVKYTFGAGIHVDRDLAQKYLAEEKDDAIRSELNRILEYFENKSTCEIFDRSLSEYEKRCIEMKVFWAGRWGGHTLLDYDLLLREGTIGLRQRINQRMVRAQNNDEREWLQSLILICHAFEDFALRYAARAREMLDSETDLDRRREFLSIEAVCRRVPMYPATRWREALQAFWFAFVFDNIDSPGRFDQYMYPYFRHSLDSGQITRDEIQQLLEKLWIRFERVRAWNLCIGGQTADGEDATNELSYMILDVAKKYGYQAPNLTMRCHKNTPLSLWDKAIDVIASGIGMPALYNDEAVIPAMLRFGIPLPDARDYAMNGCNQIDIQGKSHMGLEDGELNLLKCLELALNRGRCRLTGQQLGPDTGDPREFKTFDQVMAAYKKQVEYFTRLLTDVANRSQKIYAEHAPDPFRSLLVSDCMEKCRDFKDGGPRYNHGQILTEGIANTADSLAAIKRLVFEEKRISMARLVEALDKDFEGHEDVKNILDANVHRYGNDDDYVDSIAVEIVGHFFSELMKYRTYRGGIYGGGCSTFVRAPEFGMYTGATPDGRYARTPVADSVGPCQGKDRKGPTAVLNSVAKVDHTLAQSGYVLNLKFNKSLLQSYEAKQALRDLIRTFFMKGGQQIQINVLSADELIAAKREPEKYRNLVVRVGGFSAYFVDLNSALQDDIIARTAHGL